MLLISMRQRQKTSIKQTNVTLNSSSRRVNQSCICFEIFDLWQYIVGITYSGIVFFNLIFDWVLSLMFCQGLILLPTDCIFHKLHVNIVLIGVIIGFPKDFCWNYLFYNDGWKER